jgi:AcrR family transcriptional regulator
MGGPRPRERILVAATRLFADEGIHATSVDRVIAEAGVAPMTVYRHFAGKDELVSATLERWSQQWLTWLRAETGEDDTDPGARLERLWDALEKWFADETFRGSYVANVATELRAKPSHPAQAVIATHRAALRELLQDIAAADVPSPPEAALQLHMLVDGATAAAVVDRQPGAAASARAIATTVLSERQPVRA